MHPKSASFLAELQLEERHGAVRQIYLLPPRDISERPKFPEHRRAKSRSPKSPLRSIRTANYAERRRKLPIARFF